jgi:beta-phosphoglucomutase-like phosphatase (HAD superfamily)
MIRFAIFTYNNFHFDLILSGHDDLKDYFDSEGTNKPKPYIYLHTAKLLGIAPSQCVVIEDSSSGVSAAVDAGCFTIAIPNAFTKQQDLSRVHLRIQSLDKMDIENFLQMVICH